MQPVKMPNNSLILAAYNGAIPRGTAEYFIEIDRKWHGIKSLRPDLTEDQLKDMWSKFPGGLDEFYRKLSRG